MEIIRNGTSSHLKETATNTILFILEFFCVPFPLSLCMESTSYVLSFRMVFFLPFFVTTDWIFDASLCDNSINQSINQLSPILSAWPLKPVVGVGKRGAYHLAHRDLPRQHPFGTTLRFTGPVPADSRQ